MNPPSLPNLLVAPHHIVVAGAMLMLIDAATVCGGGLPAVPQGVSVLNTVGDKALRDGILGNPNVDMISVSVDWSAIQPDPTDPYVWDDIDEPIAKISDANKSVLLRINSMGGSESEEGSIPDWIFEAMGEDPTSLIADPGVTYSFSDSGDSIPRCIPVFWQPTYLAKKKAMIAMAGAYLSAKYPALKVFVLSYASAITDDWYVPNDPSGPPPSQVDLWLNDPSAEVDPGAGYTTQKMIDAAIHVGDVRFTDGSVAGLKLRSPSATFTQADVGCVITGRGYGSRNSITKWLSPTQVILKKRLRGGNGADFTMIARKDGLIDVAMAAFPNQCIATAVGGNGPDLDAKFIPEGEDPGTYLAKTVDNMAEAAYHGRYIVQRNNVTAVIPSKQTADDSTAWILLAEAADAGIPTAGQALGVCWNNEEYRMNGGNNCDRDNSLCDPLNPPCQDTCALDYATVLQRSADRLISYSASYYEIYPPDASNLQDIVANIHMQFNPGGARPSR
jgi:hypothetical protein